MLLGLALCGALAAFATIVESPDTELLLPRGTQIEVLPIDMSAAVLRVPDRYLREERFNRGDTLSALLSRLGVADEEAARLGRLPALRALRPGLTVTAEVGGGGELLQLNFISGRDVLVSLARAGDSWLASSEPAPLETRVLMKSGTIRSSLFGAADAAGVPDSVAIQLADIFGGDIDFHRDLRRGDRFSVVYEMNYLNGRAVRSGRVLSAEFVNQGKELRAVYHIGEDSEGRKVGGYYGSDGKNLRKAFLRSPLEFSRISSGFGMRMHPFLQTWRAHKGIDYAAPSGTRVRAVGDAVVDFAGRQGGYGNMVILRHHGQYTTVYAHLSGFAQGVRKGARVAQGDILGFVGQTGWATGPHLHYEFRISGEARNPLSIAMPAALPVPPQAMAAFRRVAEPLVARLDLMKQSNLALLD
jgi:murein DD-endopeptidase MepM/ murein hydrolase activator NlpD